MEADQISVRAGQSPGGYSLDAGAGSATGSSDGPEDVLFRRQRPSERTQAPDFQGDPIWLSELDVDSYPWRLEGRHVHRVSNTSADLSELSKSDVIALEAAFNRCSNTTFNERTAATHGRDWQAANMGVMCYEDMIDESDTKDETVEYLREAGRFIRL
jgi:hypothetical protein